MDIPSQMKLDDFIMEHTHIYTHLSIYLSIYAYTRAFNKFPDFFVQAFKIVVDS